MAITRRQFVTRLGALAAAAGFSQVEAAKIMDAMAYTSGGTGDVYKGTFGKPRVIWLHGAECTGCSTSLLGIFENAAGEAIDHSQYWLHQASPLTVADAAITAGILPSGSGLVGSSNDFTLGHNGLSPDPAGSMDIADVVIDVVDILYHETIMGMGGDTAYQWLVDFQARNGATPFVLVVEGAMQLNSAGGAWGDTSNTNVPWCSIAHDDAPAGEEIATADLVKTLAENPVCVAVIAIGQCASFGGYPGCKPQINDTVAGKGNGGFDPSRSQTDATGVYEFLSNHSSATAANKVINAPGCPTNPWWFVLTVVLFLVDAPSLLTASAGTVGTLGTLRKYQTTTPTGAFYADPAQNALALGPNPAAVDGNRRLVHVYGVPVHSTACPRYPWFERGIYAQYPGDAGCLFHLGCKGMTTNSLCGVHGWNGQQPNNDASWDNGIAMVNPNVQADGTTRSGHKGGHCTRAGHPCMACTEAGYPDHFVPFIVRS